jgi:hypothetical protein
MVSDCNPSSHVGETLRWIELAERLRGTEASLLPALALARGLTPDLTATTALVLSEAQVEELLTACAEVGDRAEQVRMLAESVRISEIELRLRTLQAEAEAALSAGTADIERAEVLARCLPVKTGFQALAAMLRCTDCHESWNAVTIGHLLGCFRDADPHFVRRVTGMATLSPEAGWDECDREQLGRLATVLERHAGATHCR